MEKDQDMGSILIIEDDATLLRLLASHLTFNGYEVLLAGSGSCGLAMAREATPDLVLLDIMMPAMDGWEVCQRLRDFSDVPIIMLTARTMETDVIKGLMLGADDYIRKPFNLHELTLRIKAVLKRTGGNAKEHAAPPYSDGTLTVDHDRRLVVLNCEPVHLSPTEFRLLSYLVQNAGRTVPRCELLCEVWGPEYADDTSILPVYIRYLRQKLEQVSASRYIATEWGVGYRFIPKPFAMAAAPP